MYGNFVSKVNFKTTEQYKTFVNDSNHKHILFEDRIKPEIQFLVDRYYTISDDEMAEKAPELKVYYIDIEVNRDRPGFPKPEIAEDPIVLISIFDQSTEKIVSFGLKPFTSTYEGDKFYYCATEKELIQKFLGFMKRYPCDVISGWNIRNFDLLYIYNRIKNLFGASTRLYHALSPAGYVNYWEKEKEYGLTRNIDIAGISILDYMELYKMYSGKRLESFSLQYVSNHELEKGKFDYSTVAQDLKSLYDKDWNTYVEYNKTDVKRVRQLEDKMGLITLVQGLSLFTKCPMKFCDKQTSLIEAAMLTYLRRNNMCAPAMPGGRKKAFEAAIVKDPLIGKYEWIVDADITSSYPTHIIALNMSNETYYGRVEGFTEQEILGFINKKEFPEFKIVFFGKRIEKIVSDANLKAFNNSVKKGLLTISPNGIIFKTKPAGCFADVERTMFNHRKEIKDKMLGYFKGGQRVKAIQMRNSQMAIKTTLNGIYGSFSVPYSRYFNLDIAEAITSCGRHTLRSGMDFVNEISNNPNDELMSILGELYD